MNDFLESVLSGILREFLIDNWYWIALGVAVVGFHLYELFFGKRRLKKAARKLHEQQQSAFGSGFRWTTIDLQRIPKLDTAYYEKTTTDLGAIGFQAVGDVELLHITEAHPGMRSALRVFACAHGHILAAAYHLRVGGLMGMMSLLFKGARNFRVLEFETALSDGRYITTTNAGKLLGMSSPEGVLKFPLPKNTPLEQLLAAHIANVKEQLATTPNVSPISAQNLAQIMQLQELQHALEQKHRSQTGVFTDEELQRLVPGIKRGDRKVLVAEAERLRDEQSVTV